jgi:hypothetical protein
MVHPIQSQNPKVTNRNIIVPSFALAWLEALILSARRYQT